MRFTFGQNWLRFSELLDERRIADAEANLQRLLDLHSLEGRSFMDVGAGSGLFSIAAARLGARPVVALDRDEQCLAAIRGNCERFLADDAHIVQVRQADVLQRESLGSDAADIVYAWGSLHHTGAMWRAIENASSLCCGGGLFVLAIYNRTAFSELWLAAKRMYAAAPSAVGLAMAAALCGTRAVLRLIRGRHPLRTGRGMNVWYDAVDWLGGLPYECATSDELVRFVERLGFVEVRARLTRRSGCNELTFQRRPS
jgi:SAM-dependent methyltransferase